ncbi:MAG: NADH-quinone oxidoreductase subunit N [Saprospiraceae bacterium]
MNTIYILSGLGILSLVGAMFDLKKMLPFVLLVGIVVAMISGLYYWGISGSYFNQMISLDRFSSIYFFVLLFILFVWFFAFSRDTVLHEYGFEKLALIFFSAVGGLFMISFNHLVILFLGIEILSIPLYVLAASHRHEAGSIEAGVKYFLLSSMATGFLLFGIALIYGATGSFHMNEIQTLVTSHHMTIPSLLPIGIILTLIGLCFKVSAVPFHFWTPDVYEGSPTEFTAFMSTSVKLAAFAGLYRFLVLTSDPTHHSMVTILLICSILSIIIGNILANYPSSAKRLLAYSSIAQAGYLLIPMIYIQSDTQKVLVYGLVAYLLASLALFTVIYAMEKTAGFIEIKSFNGLGKSHPVLAFCISICLFSLAGIPPLAGFMGKYMIFTQAMSAGLNALTVVAILFSLVGVYYYFKIVIAMYLQPQVEQTFNFDRRILISIILLSTLLVILGLFPDLLFQL